MTEDRDESAKGHDPIGIVRRVKSERKRLDPDFEDLAAGESDRVRPPRGVPRLRDDRAVRLVPGVKNSDVRRLFEARLEALRAVRADHPADPGATAKLGRLLAEAWALEAWRGQSLTSFEVMTEQLLDLDGKEARELAQKAADEGSIPVGHLSDEAIASWMRAEVALMEAELEARVEVVRTEEGERLLLDIDAKKSPEVLSAIGHKLTPIANDRAPRDRDRGGERGRGGGGKRGRSAEGERERGPARKRERSGEGKRNRDHGGSRGRDGG